MNMDDQDFEIDSKRPKSKPLDDILGTRFQVLADGFIRVVDYMGSDSAVVQAARVSYGAGTKRVQDDLGLIRYLMRNNHTTPFEMCELKLHVRVPMDTWRQWIRHRTASVNEYSTRYSIAIDAAHTTRADQWRTQSTSNHQGSDVVLASSIGEELSRKEHALHEHSRATYLARLEAGVAREQARKDLPLSTYTEAYWKVNLHNLLHFLDLRMDAHAQFEIRQYAQVIGAEIVSRWCPFTWEAYLDYRQNSIVLTGREVQILGCLNSGDDLQLRQYASDFGWLDSDGNPAPNRERREAEKKFISMGLKLPWTKASE